MNRWLARLILLILFLQMAPQWNAQKPPVKYWIMFKDKDGTPFSVSNPGAFLTQSSVNRRINYGIPFDFTDLPVTPSYITQIASVANVKVIQASKWMNGVVIQLDSSDLAANALNTINGFSFVKSNRQVKKYKVDAGPGPQLVEPPAPIKSKGNEQTSSKGLSGYAYGNSAAQIRQLNLHCLHDKGYRGQGMTIAVLDAGFAYVDSNPIYDSIRARNGILGTRDFVSGGNYAYQGSTHGSMVFSCLAANYPGLVSGTAPMANYWLLRTEEPTENIGEEFNWIRGAEFADSVGADVLTTSLGYTEFDNSSMNHTYATLNGRTAPMSIAANMAARKGMFVLNSAGNERASDWHFISVPADADSVCAVAAVDSLGRDAAFSSVGPTPDGRIKPDLAAVGVGAWVCVGDPQGFPANGTSFSCPVLAGAVACYWQANRSLNNIELLRELKNNASNASNPNNLIGWGMPNLCPSIPFDFSVYIDPVTSVIHILLVPGDYSEIVVDVVDLNGRRVFSRSSNVKDRKVIIDGGTLADGVYLVKVKSSLGTKSKKTAKGSI